MIMVVDTNIDVPAIILRSKLSAVDGIIQRIQAKTIINFQTIHI